MPADETKLTVAAELLLVAGDRFAQHTCNDFSLAVIIPDLEERRALVREYHEWNGDPEELDPNGTYEFHNDAALMHFLGQWLLDKLAEYKAGAKP